MATATGTPGTSSGPDISTFVTYEDYLNDQITEKDMYYLEVTKIISYAYLSKVEFQDEDLARQLVELGYRGSGETLKREEFDAKKREIEYRKHPTARKKEKVK